MSHMRSVVCPRTSLATHVIAALAVAICLGNATALAQAPSGEIFGTVKDTSGAVVPGVTVTLTSPSLIVPRVVSRSKAAAIGSQTFPSAPTR